jgi:hypothetical protein
MAETQTQFRADQVPVVAAILQKPMDAITRHHYENLATGKEVRHKDGKVSTVYTIQVEIDGKPTLIPTVWDGKIIQDQEEAKRRAVASGKKWPQRKTHQELRKFDQAIHQDMKDISAEEARKILSRIK